MTRLLFESLPRLSLSFSISTDTLNIANVVVLVISR